ncbi:MAG TPA: S49 family peptidase [Lacipirellulaceae bacterium]|nr:S49 family peptidase [Lacipirellulaceae bacterium]
MAATTAPFGLHVSSRGQHVAVHHSWFSLLIPVVLLVCILGCAQPLRVDTRANVDATGNLNVDATGNLKAELAPTPLLQPVTAMGVPHWPQNPQSPRIAVVDVDGLLLDSDATGLGSWGENPVSSFRERLDAIECDPRVRGVVIRINTPGGSVTATDIMWRDLTAFKHRTCMPIVACLMDVAAGGGYYLAVAADKIVAHPTSITGGIGCILNVYNLQDLMGQFNILGIPIKSGANIDLGSPIKALSPENRKLLQNMADEFHARFRTVVLKGRPMVDGKIESTFDGRVFTAKTACDLHLIDQIGYLDNAVALVRTMAGVGYADVVFYHRREDPVLSPYSITPNTPLQKTIIPINVPGLDRSKLPCFLYLWQMEPSAEAALGK